MGVPAVDPAIAQVAETYRNAVLAGDAAAAASVFLEDGVEMPFGHPPVRGRTAIERYYRECFAGPCRFTGFVLSPWDVTVAGKVAFNVGGSQQSIPAGGSTIECSGKYLVVLRRDGAGAWKVAYAIYNVDAPLPAPPAR